jgi:hypothetical protein
MSHRRWETHYTPSQHSDLPPRDFPLRFLRAEQLVGYLVHLHRLHAVWDLGLFLVEHALAYAQNVEEFFLGEARASLPSSISATSSTQKAGEQER